MNRADILRKYNDKEDKKVKNKEQKPKEAFIVSVVTDQGTGGSWCSNCGYDLGQYLKKWTKETFDDFKKMQETGELGPESEGFYKCPKCGAKLKWGGIYVQPGRSDF